MRLTRVRSVIIVCSALAGCASASTAPTTTPPPNRPPVTTQLDPRAFSWTEDMQQLAESIRRIHPDPFWRQSEAEFDAALAAAPARLAALSASDAAAEVMRLLANIDGHTGVYLGEAGFHLYALHLYLFGDEINVIAAPDPTLVGARVVSIDATPIADAIDAVTPYSLHDNASTVDLVVPTLLITPEVLHAAGVIGDTDAPRFALVLHDGTETTLDPEQLTWPDYAQQIDPRPIGMTSSEAIPALARLDEPFWTDLLPGAQELGGQTLYVQYNEVIRRGDDLSIDQLAEQIDATLSAGGITRLIVDLRFNPGGDDRTYRPLLQVLTNNPALSTPGSLVVLIGRQTFSAAVLFATELDALTDAVFIGEATGGSPNLYGDPRPITLRNSELVVQVASKYYDTGGPSDHRDAITPDTEVPFTLDDLLAGRDPVLAAAIV